MIALWIALAVIVVGAFVAVVSDLRDGAHGVVYSGPTGQSKTDAPPDDAGCRVPPSSDRQHTTGEPGRRESA